MRHNELQQRENRTLWSYVAERRSNSHVFREQVIETVEAPFVTCSQSMAIGLHHCR